MANQIKIIRIPKGWRNSWIEVVVNKIIEWLKEIDHKWIWE